MATQAHVSPSDPLFRRPPMIAVGVAATPRVRLLRLAAIAALTGAVVIVGALQGDAVSHPAGVAQITLPAAAASPALGEFRAGDVVRSAPAPAPAENALPRPPDIAEPLQPARFARVTLQRGDTVFDLSVIYDVAIVEILRFNPDLGDGSRVDVGQVVLVPIFSP